MDYFLVPVERFSSFSIASVMRVSGNVADSPANSILRTDIGTSVDLQNFVMTSCSPTMLPFHANNLHLLRNIYAPKVCFLFYSPLHIMLSL
jgi:hypothetical protein